MRYSANLNVIIKSIEKATAHMSRDFIELENLQSNPASADRFANACYNRVKQVLFDDFTKIRPEYNIIFSDGQKIIRKADAEYNYVIHVIDGFDNLKRSNPDFTVAVALEHNNVNGQKEAISVAVNKIFGGELYYCEKGFGAYLNSRRIRVSKRMNGQITVASADKRLLSKEQNLRSYGCKTLDIAYVASSRLEKAIYKNNNLDLYKPFTLLVREAGGKVVEEDDKIIVTN